jgi:hypothetical protein
MKKIDLLFFLFFFRDPLHRRASRCRYRCSIQTGLTNGGPLDSHDGAKKSTEA